MHDCDLEALLEDLESDRVERKASPTDREKICQAICAFANDLPDHRLPGVIFVGVHDDGSCADLTITDEMLRGLADIRSNGNLLPFPSMTVQKKILRGCETVVIVVQPSDSPPVRYKGRVWIRVGPRRAIATAEEERRLAEKRRSKDLPFDIRPIDSASLDDLDEDLFVREYLPCAVAPDILEKNARSVGDQMASLRFLTAEPPRAPTALGVLALGKDVLRYLPGAYIQFVRVEGVELTDPLKPKPITGNLFDVLRRLDDLLEANLSVAVDVTAQRREVRQPDYPLVALQQLTRNAVLHRNYETSNAPVRITWFEDRIEIQNPGGLFGQVNRENFGRPGVTDYRNPHLAEVMANLGYVQKFGMGIPLARKALRDNGNPDPEFVIEDTYFLAVVRKRS